MLDGSEKRYCEGGFELKSLRVCEKGSKGINVLDHTPVIQKLDSNICQINHHMPGKSV